MIPYFQFTAIHLGPISIQIWGLFVATGILVGTAVGAWAAKKRGLRPEIVWDLSVWVTLAGIIGARVFHVLFYDLSFYAATPLEVFAIWNGGMSIIGGFLAASGAAVWYLRRRKVNILAYIDATIIGLPVGYGIGRIGCFLIHDHPGTLTHFILGVKYPDGVRHDLGFYESLLGFFLAAVFFVLWRRNAKQGTYTVVFLLGYGIARFFFDFLRATDGPIVDARYVGLTPAQYIALLMIGLGIYGMRKLR